MHNFSLYYCLVVTYLFVYLKKIHVNHNVYCALSYDYKEDIYNYYLS